jgi:hypothetical protein
MFLCSAVYGTPKKKKHSKEKKLKRGKKDKKGPTDGNPLKKKSITRPRTSDSEGEKQVSIGQLGAIQDSSESFAFYYS